GHGCGLRTLEQPEDPREPAQLPDHPGCRQPEPLRVPSPRGSGEHGQPVAQHHRHVRPYGVEPYRQSGPGQRLAHHLERKDLPGCAGRLRSVPGTRSLQRTGPDGPARPEGRDALAAQTRTPCVPAPRFRRGRADAQPPSTKKAPGKPGAFFVEGLPPPVKPKTKPKIKPKTKPKT